MRCFKSTEYHSSRLLILLFSTAPCTLLLPVEALQRFNVSVHLLNEGFRNRYREQSDYFIVTLSKSKRHHERFFPLGVSSKKLTSNQLRNSVWHAKYVRQLEEKLVSQQTFRTNSYYIWYKQCCNKLQWMVSMTPSFSQVLNLIAPLVTLEFIITKGLVVNVLKSELVVL